jgi:hypothetical protein
MSSSIQNGRNHTYAAATRYMRLHLLSILCARGVSSEYKMRPSGSQNNGTAQTNVRTNSATHPSNVSQTSRFLMAGIRCLSLIASA